MSYHHLTRKERGLLSQLYHNGIGIREIARRLCRSPGTVSREIKRNSENGCYRSPTAHAAYLTRRENCRRKPLCLDQELMDYITEKLLLTWSPEQIAGRIRLDFPRDETMRVSHSSIYRWLEEGLLPHAIQLKKNLRHYGHKHGEIRGTKIGARELKTRCKEALKRSRLGDWEADTIVFGQNAPGRAHILNVTDRKSRYCCLMLLKHTQKVDMMRAFSFFFQGGKLPLKTMTSDRGVEFNCHREFEEAFEALFYYTRPSSPWQKPTVENTNGLVRQFFPKALAPSELSQQDVAHVMHLLNNRPRKSLHFKTPTEVLHFT